MILWKRKLTVLLFYGPFILLVILSHFSDVNLNLLLSPILLLLCFATLGIITADFLTPNLSVISKEFLLLSPRISGMTLLALGNAIPDISSTYASLRRGAVTLAISESLGAIFFLLTVVIGFMASIKTIQLSSPHDTGSDLERGQNSKDYWDTIFYCRNQFLKDLFMFGFLISIGIYFLLDGTLKFWECIVMCLAYGAYITYLILSGKELEAMNNDEEIPAPTVSVAHSDDNLQKFLRMAKETRRNFRRKVRQYLRKNYKGCANLKVNDTLDLWEHGIYFDHELDEALSQADSPLFKVRSRRNSETMVEQIQQKLHILPNDLQATHEVGSPLLGFSTNERESLPLSENKFERHISNNLEIPLLDKKTAFRSVSADNLSGMNDQQSLISHIVPPIEDIGKKNDKEFKDSWDSKLRIMKYLTDPNYEVDAMEVVMILSITPLIFILTLLIPLHYESKRDNMFFTITYYIQCVFTPFIVNLLITKSFNLTLFVLGSAIGTIAVILIYLKVLKLKEKFIAPFGFVSSIATISFVVGLVLDILTGWVSIFQISESILGLTVFAWGNSVGDLASNVTFTHIGVLEIALGSCFGSPLLYFLFGVGLDGILVLLKNQSAEDSSIWFRYIDFDFNSNLISSSVGIGIAFFIFVVIVPLNHWKLDKKIGGLLLTLYFAFTIINVLLEFNSSN